MALRRIAVTMGDPAGVGPELCLRVLAQPAVTRLTGKEYDSAFKAQMVAHIVAFSLNGLGLEEEGA